MDNAKSTYREGEQTAKETWRKADGDESLSDKVGNVGDEMRKDAGNAGDDLRRGVNDLEDDAHHGRTGDDLDDRLGNAGDDIRPVASLPLYPRLERRPPAPPVAFPCPQTVARPGDPLGSRSARRAPAIPYRRQPPTSRGRCSRPPRQDLPPRRTCS